MATKKEIMLQLLKGVSWNDTARALGNVQFLTHFDSGIASR